MLINFRGFLRHLPLNTDLVREFLAGQLFNPQPPLDWALDEPALATMLADAIDAYPDTAIRDDLIAALEQIAQLADGPGVRQMLSVGSAEPRVAAALATRESPEERALWLYVNSPAKFNEAVLARLFDDGMTSSSSQRWSLPSCPDLQLDPATQSAISTALSAFYQQRFGYGREHQPYVVQRHLEGSLLLVIDLSDLACNRAVWERGKLRRGPLVLSRTLALNYHPASGRTETVAPGGADAHTALVSAFAESALRQPGRAARVQKERYRLSALLNGVDIFDRAAIGIDQPRLKSITVLDPVSGLRSRFEVAGRGNKASVEQLIGKAYPSDLPLARSWQVVGAVIELPFFPEVTPGGERRKVLPLRFNAKGQANLHRFTEDERRLIEPLLTEWGLLDAPPPPVSVPVAQPAA